MTGRVAVLLPQNARSQVAIASQTIGRAVRRNWEKTSMAAAAFGLRKMAVDQNAITPSSLQHSVTGGVPAICSTPST
jgi:hypothetical protein